MDKKKKLDKFSHDKRGKQYIDDANFREDTIKFYEDEIRDHSEAINKGLDVDRRKAKIKVLKNKLASFMKRNPRGPASK